MANIGAFLAADKDINLLKYNLRSQMFARLCQ
jgi:hypothetical protein